MEPGTYGPKKGTCAQKRTFDQNSIMVNSQTDEKHPAVCAAVIDAADRLFERYGYRKTTVEEIAQEAGIGKGSVYLHFASKEEIAFAWVDRLHSRLHEQLEEIAKEGIERFLCQRVLLRYDIFHRHQRSMDEALDRLGEGLRARRDAFHEVEAKMLAGMLDASACRLDPLKTARSMIVATNGLMPYRLRPQELGARKLVEAKVKDLAALLSLAIRGGKK